MYSSQYASEISRLFPETKHQEFDIPSSPISINNATTSSYSPSINNSSSLQSQSQESSPESILGRRFNYTTQFGATGLQQYENQKRVFIDGGTVDKPEITNEHARNACEDPDIGFEFPRKTIENSKESYDISRILNAELSAPKATPQLSLDIQYTKFQMGLETLKRMWDTEMVSETTKGIWNSQMGVETPNRIWDSQMGSQTPNRISNSQTGLETPKRMWDTEMGSETIKGIWNSQMGVETPNRIWNSQMGSQTPNRISNSQTGSETPYRISNLQTGSETTKGIWNSQMGVETPNRIWNSQMDSQTPNRISNSQTGSETPYRISNLQTGSEMTKGIWNSQMGVETPNRIWNSQMDLETPNRSWNSQMGLETPNRSWNSQMGSETPNRSWNSQMGSETPNTSWNSQMGSETPNRTWNSQMGSETPNRSWNSQMASETPNRFRNSQIDFETALRTLNTDMIPQRNSNAKPVFKTQRTVSLCDSDDFAIWQPLDPMQTMRSSTPHQSYELFPNVENACFRAKTPSPPTSSRNSEHYLHASSLDQSFGQSSLLEYSLSPSTVVDGPPVYVNIIKPNYICTFCRKNGETPSVYTSHVVKMKDGRKTIVTCPILRSLVCNVCHQSGDNAHTITYCPELRRRNNGQPLNSTTIYLKNTRLKSNGRKRY